MDGMEYAKDGWQPWGWGSTSLDNVTNAWEQGFLGECVRAGPSRCALAGPHSTTIDTLTQRMDILFERLLNCPIPGFTVSEGPGLATYENIIEMVYSALYNPASWPKAARMLAELEGGNATLILQAVNRDWSYNPRKSPSHNNSIPRPLPETQSQELTMMVICVSDLPHLSMICGFTLRSFLVCLSR